jgi:hypothetical protein
LANLVQAPVPEERAGELDEGEVVGGVLVVADEDRAALREPGECALDDPAAGGVALLPRLVELLLADAADVGKVARLLGSRSRKPSTGTRCSPGR